MILGDYLRQQTGTTSTEIVQMDAAPRSIVNYFQAFCDKPTNGVAINADTQKGSLVYGSKKRLLERLRNMTEEDFPFVHFERPNMMPSDSGTHLSKNCFCIVNVFTKYTMDGEGIENDESQLQAEEVTMAIVDKLLMQLHHDSVKGFVEFDLNGVTIDPILDNAIPNMLGWQVVLELNLDASGKLC